MGPPPECVSCGGSAKSTAKQVTEISAISGRNLREIVTSHFWQDANLMESMGRKNASLCRECHSLLEQIDAFEQSLMKTRENFESRRSINNDRSNNHNSTAKNSKIKKESVIDGRDNDVTVHPDIPQMKQEPDEWTNQEDFEWDAENPNNFLDATLQEDMETGVADKENNGSFIDDDDDDSNDEDYDDKEDFDQTFVPRRSVGRPPKNRVNNKPVKTPEMSLYEMCLAKPDRRLMCQDKTTLGADWFAEQRTLLKMILTEFELDLEYFREKMPSRLATAEDSHSWNIAVLRSEAEVLECGMPGELSCLICNKDFPTFAKKLEHIIEFHCGDERQFICGVCPEYDEIDEANMFKHISENHVVSDENSDKSKYGPRDPVTNEVDETFACRLCPIVSRSELAYWYHWYCRHKKYRLRHCDICSKSTGLTTASKFRSHFLTEHCNYVYECYDCDVHLMTTDLFQIHIKEHEKKSGTGALSTAKAGRVKKRNYPAERKPRTKRNSVGIKQEDTGIPEDDSNAEPLTGMSRILQNPELCLEPISDTLQLSEQLSPEIWLDLCNGLNLLKSMPSKVDNDITSLEWDVTLLKLECPKLAFGIPGEKKCFKCEDFFIGIPEKQTHCLYTHHSDPYFCAICQQAFGKEASGVAHMANKHADELWKTDGRMKVPESYTTCEICGLSCASDLAYWHHKYQSHKRYKNVGCPLCETSCNNFILFLRHVLIKHGNYKYKCFLCDKTSKSMESFKDHLKQHDKGKIKKENSFLGEEDEDSVFEREEIEINGKKILRKKIGKKGKKPPVACEICGTISKGAFNNARHLYTMHGIKREVQCDKCDTLCESVRAMLEHKKNHHSSASCHLCGKVFVEKGHLENHLMRHGIGKDGKNHQNERDFMCEICSKTFTRKNYLVIHMKNHAEKSIKCTVCAKMFRWNSALQAHLTAAHGMGPKEGACTCEFCGRQFQDKSNYRQHRYTHLQIKPFNCEACGKGFIRRDLMKSHKEKCHAATAFSMG